MFKYADDTNLLVPENTDIPLSNTPKFCHIQLWAELNGLIINLDKIKELVLHRSLIQSVVGIERVFTAGSDLSV